MSKVNFLPTKFKYNNKNKSIEMYYRLSNNIKLNMTEIPFDHYIYIDPTYNKYGSINENDIYKLLTTEENLIQVYLNPGEARELYMSERYLTGEADCSPEQRFVVDTFANTEFPPNISPRILFLDIETFSTDNKLPTFNHNVAEINAITVYDSYLNKFISFFLIPDNKNVNEYLNAIKEEIKEYGTVDIKLFTSAKALLNAFMQYVISDCPDIITAWNSGFDIPYIVRKIIDNFGIDALKKISPFNKISSKVIKALDNNSDLFIDTLIPGIDIIDMLELYKKNTPGQKPSYSLKAITEEELGETKLTDETGDTDPNHMYLHDFTNFCKYNIQDVRLLVLLEKKLKLLDLAIIMRNITKCNFQDIFFESIMIDNMFLMEAVRRRKEGSKYILPSRPINAVKQKYLGAYVKDPLRGRYPWVADLDFTSLYPSIVKTFKLSNESIVGFIDKKQIITLYSIAKQFNIADLNYIKDNILPKYLSYDIDLVSLLDNYNEKDINIDTLGNDLDINIEYYPLFTNKEFPSKFNGLTEFTDWLKENNFALLPNGVVVNQNREDAIIAKVIADIMKSRAKYKTMMKDYLSKGNKELFELYNIYQTAIKIVNNSVYGVTATERFRLFDIRIADAITTAGQVLIRSCTYTANKYLNEQSHTDNVDYVLTNDTDSIIFTLKGIVNQPTTIREPEILANIATNSKKCQDYINEYLYNICKNIFYKYKVNKNNNFLSMKNEWLADAGLFVAKKMYVVHKVFKEGIPYEKLDSTGISLRRSSTPQALKPFLKNVITNILEFKNQNEIDSIIIDECNKLSTEYEIKDIAIPSSLNDLSSYANVPIHVRGINIWNKYFAKTEKDQLKFGKIKYFYVKQWENNELNLNKEYVLSVPNIDSYWSFVNGKVKVDYKKMKDRLIIKPINAFYSALGWTLPLDITTTNNGIFNIFSKNQTNEKNKIKYI